MHTTHSCIYNTYHNIPSDVLDAIPAFGILYHCLNIMNNI